MIASRSRSFVASMLRRASSTRSGVVASDISLCPLLGKGFGGCAGLVDVVIARSSHDQALFPNGDNRNAKLNSTGAAHRTGARTDHAKDDSVAEVESLL